MNQMDEIAAYIDAACALHGLALAPDQRLRIIQTFGMTAQLVAPLMAFELPPEIETAPVFKA